MLAFGSSSKTGRLPLDEPRRAAGASSSSMGASSRTPSRASSRPLSIPHASTKKERDVRAASRAPKRALAPGTPSPSSHTPLTRTRAALLPGRDPPPSARGSEVSPARSPPSGSAEKKKAARLDEGVPAVRNLLFEDGPKTYCAVDEPPFSVGHDKRGSPTSSPIDPSASPIEAPRTADGALALAKTRRMRFSSHLLPVDAATASSTRLAELRLADETWRRVAFRIARAGGTRGDALAASAREVFRRLAAALPPETDEETAFAASERSRTLADAPGGASRFSHRAPLLLDCVISESDGITAPYREVERRTDTGVQYAIDALSRSFVFKKSLRRASSARLTTSARAAIFTRVARASLASLAFLALASVVVFAVRDARRRSPARAFQRDAPPPS